MVVIVVENLLQNEKGIITRWLIEAKAGVFIGNANSVIREKIWERVLKYCDRESSALMIYKDDTEQGYSIKMAGTPKRYVVEFEGLSFVATKINA